MTEATTVLNSTQLRPCIGVAACLLVWLVLSGCGNLTVGGVGDVEVTVSGDAVEAGTLGAGLLGHPTPFATQSDDEPEGEVEAEFELFLIDIDGRSAPLTTNEIRVRVDVRGRMEADAVRAQVPSGQYVQLRMVFTEIDAEIESGLVIDGIPVVGDVRVRLDGVSLSVSRPVEVMVEDGGLVRLLIDLNSTTWLRAADPNLREVAEMIFRDAVAVRTR